MIVSEAIGATLVGNRLIRGGGATCLPRANDDLALDCIVNMIGISRRIDEAKRRDAILVNYRYGEWRFVVDSIRLC